MTALRQLQTQQLRPSSCSSISTRAIAPAATTTSSWHMTAFMPRSMVPVSAASSISSAGTSSDERVQRERRMPASSKPSVVTKHSNAQKSRADNNTRAVAGALAVPHSVADGSATRRARGGRIEGGSDG